MAKRKFTVEHNGITYQCYADIDTNDKKTMSQWIYVDGCGDDKDESSY